jgi:protein-tyrosine phosphatase
VETPVRILAVCLGNICRSPAAEAAISEAAQEAGVVVEVESAGTGSWHVGEPPDPRMVQAAASVGLQIAGTARQVRPEDFSDFDLIVAMDRNNYDDIVALAPDGEAAAKVRMFRSYDPNATGLDVLDPYYGGTEGFHQVVAATRAAARGLVGSLRA